MQSQTKARSPSVVHAVRAAVLSELAIWARQRRSRAASSSLNDLGALSPAVAEWSDAQRFDLGRFNANGETPEGPGRQFSDSPVAEPHLLQSTRGCCASDDVDGADG
ncbi:MAG TPA: hypothetical protein H9793_11870 [Candidatus Brevibacterium intestinigallinarum]|nr:hypothetical protein [Candidatus Brevibacterium intestinigallinarum]